MNKQKLSEEHQKLLKMADSASAFTPSAKVIYSGYVEDALKSMQQLIGELEKENAELRHLVNQQKTNLDRLWHLAEDLGACSEYLKVNFASGPYIPKQSLAQHDKEVAVKAIEGLYRWFKETHTNPMDRGFRYKGYIRQLQEQE